MSEIPQQHGGADEQTVSSQPTQSETPTGASDSQPSSGAEPQVDAVTTSRSDAPTDRAPEVEAAATTAQSDSSLNDKLAELANQRDAFQSQYLRIAADFDNFRKRSSKEKEEIEVQVKCTTINELLSVVDNFERARTQIKPQNEGEMGIHKSYQGVYKQLVESLKRVGVSPMRPEGQQFDPNLHEAVMRQPTEEYPEGTVIEELQRGYYLGDRILRHSLVKVASPPEQLSADDAVEFDPDRT